MALLGRASLSSTTVPSALAGSRNGGHVRRGLDLGYAAASVAGERPRDLNGDGRLHRLPKPRDSEAAGLEMEATDLALLLEGIQLSQTVWRPRWEPAPAPG